MSGNGTRSLQEREDAIRQAGAQMREAFDAIQQPRSNYQIDHFVIAQHDTVIRQWMQAVLQLQIAVFNIARGQLSIEMLQAKADLAAENKAATESEAQRRIYDIEIRQLEVDRADVDLARLGAVREAEHYLARIRQLEAKNGGKAFTREQIEADEARYWKLRISRQSYTQQRGTLPADQIEAMLQMLTEPGEERPLLIEDAEMHNLLGVDPVPMLPGGKGE